MGVNTQSARIKHHTSTTSGSFTVPASEDFTDGSWDKWDLAKSEIAVNEADDKAFLRIGSNIRQIYPQGASSGVCGISNTSGEYTFYTTIALANAAATSGDTIEFFADVTETGATEWILKDGVNYNLNGHTYTLNVATTENAVTDNNVTATCTIFNGTIKRTGGTSSTTDTLALHIDGNSSVVYLEGVKIVSDCGTATVVDGSLFGGTHISDTNHSIRTTSTAKIMNCIARNTSAADCITNSGYAQNCHAYSSSGVAFENTSGGEAQDCSGYSDGSFAFVAGNGGAATVSINCSGYSTANYGIYSTNAANRLDGCSGYSTASYGIYYTASTAEMSRCSGYSSASYGIYVGAAAKAYNCYAYSSAAAASWVGGEVYNCTFICDWNNASGHGITCTSPNPPDYVFECTIIVTNSSANCMYANFAANVYYGNNTFKGATTSVNANITQAQTNAPDTYGNITVG